MSVTSFKGNFALVADKINEKSIENGWGISADSNYVAGINEVYYLNIKDSDGNKLLRFAARNYASIDGYGVRFYYNSGNSSIGNERNYGSGDETATVYFTSHGFILINSAYRAAEGTVAAWVNVNDDNTIIYGGTGITTGASNLYSYLIGCKYDETNYQSLSFTPHTNPSGTTLCNDTAVGSLGEPQIAKYAFYAPVYQSAITGEVEVDGERYVAYGGVWYLKD